MQLLTCSSGAANSKLFTLTTTSGSATSPSTVRATAASTVPAAGKTNVQLRARGNWKCADVRGPSSADGTVIQQWSCSTPAVSQQSIDIVDDGGSNQVKVKFRNANKCLQAQADHTVVQSTCVTGAASQRWTFTEVAGGWRLSTALNGRCLNSAPSGGDGTGLTMVACAGTPLAAELWSLTSPANGSVVDLDADLPALPTVTYVRDATGRIVERKVNGTTEARYSFGGSGDSPTLMLNASNAVVGASISLPGGVLYQWIPSTPTASIWNYPNLQGSLTASANQAGAKLGATRVHDPDGNQLVGSETDTGPGQFDYGWLGQHQRPLEHQDGLQSVIQMGERQYAPALGRFLEVDPVEGGTSNDYAYVGDPINRLDLNGMWCVIHNSNGGCRGAGVLRSVVGGAKSVVRETYQVARFSANSANGSTAVGLVLALIAGASCSWNGQELMILCTEAKRLRVKGGFTFGNVFITDKRRVGPDLLRHEAKHADQWALMGWSFAALYVGSSALVGECNVWEAMAGYADGGYTQCLPQGVVK